MWSLLLEHALRHAALAAGALILACLVGAPLGAWAALSPRVRGPILGTAALGRTIPSIALLMLLLPILGVGIPPALAALALLAVAPIAINVDLGIRSVAPDVLDAATGLGMNARERFARVRLPLAMPLAIAGVRTAGVEVIASATLATFIGAGGLGDDIVRGMQTGDVSLLVAACACVAAMAFVAEFFFSKLGARMERAL